MGGKQKGNNFEREVCKQLSLWWSGDSDDNVFWRSQSSGGRATQRTSRQKETRGQHGDVAADLESGRRLIDMFTIELKRGYNGISIVDLIDRPQRATLSVFETWVSKLEESLFHSGCLSWWLIHRKDRRETMVYLPLDVIQSLKTEKILEARFDVHVTFACWVRLPSGDQERLKIMGMPLNQWLQTLDPLAIKNFSGII